MNSSKEGWKRNEKKEVGQSVEYYPETDEILLIRCPECGRENYAPAVLGGMCGVDLTVVYCWKKKEETK